jgi:hypothetical protein
MRTTLTLDDDVAAAIETLRRERGMTLRQAVNEALRLGLAELSRPRSRGRFRTKVRRLGACRISDLDDVAEALALAEGDAHR